MLSSISESPALDRASQLAANPPLSNKIDDKPLEEKAAFQQFAAGTFYQTMLKALRSTEKETKYFNGGRAEKIFRGQFDQQIADMMAKEHGDQFAGPLFDQHQTMRSRSALAQSSSPIASQPVSAEVAS